MMLSQKRLFLSGHSVDTPQASQTAAYEYLQIVIYILQKP